MLLLKEKISQWFFNISKFSDDLQNELDNLDQWPISKVMQQNWIGKSFGCEIDFEIVGLAEVSKIKCFTTRPDTLFGFLLALSVDHPLSKFYQNDSEFLEFKENCSKSGTTEESSKCEKSVSKQFLHKSFKHRKSSVYFANFVLMDYGFAVLVVHSRSKRF